MWSFHQQDVAIQKYMIDLKKRLQQLVVEGFFDLEHLITLAHNTRLVMANTFVVIGYNLAMVKTPRRDVGLAHEYCTQPNNIWCNAGVAV